MDIGDLLFLLLIGFGALTSLLGGKKRTRVPPPPRRPRPPAGPDALTRQRSAARPGRPPTRQPASQSAMTEMERVLRELGLETRPPVPESLPDPESPPVTTSDVDYQDEERELEKVLEARIDSRTGTAYRPPPPVVRPEPEVVSREPLEVPTEARHDEFHRRYMERSVRRKGGRAAGPLARKFLSPASLRQAILVHEILGPPKGLQ